MPTHVVVHLLPTLTSALFSIISTALQRSTETNRCQNDLIAIELFRPQSHPDMSEQPREALKEAEGLISKRLDNFRQSHAGINSKLPCLG